jgi:hypothetical protein
MGDFTKNQALLQVKKNSMKTALDPKKAETDMKEIEKILAAKDTSLSGEVGAFGATAPDLAKTLIQNNPGGTGNVATDVGSPFG